MALDAIEALVDIVEVPQKYMTDQIPKFYYFYLSMSHKSCFADGSSWFLV